MKRRSLATGVLFILLLFNRTSGQELYQAIMAGDAEAVITLLDAGADPNEVGSRGLTATDLAFFRGCQTGDSGVLGLLRERGGILDPEATWPLPLSRLHLAANFGNVELGRLLLDLGAPVDLENSRGETPLLMVARSGHPDFARMLLERGADPARKDSVGRTPLVWAVDRGHLAVVNLLLEAGAPLDRAASVDGRNPLHVAAIKGHLGIVEALVEGGVPVDAMDGEGHTAADYAGMYGHQGVFRFLLDKGGTAGEGVVTRFGPSPFLRGGVGPGNAALWYLNTRGWGVKTSSHFLVFDAEEFGVVRPTRPALANGFLTPGEIGGQDVVALFTCYHGEIGEPAYIHEIEDSLHSVVYVQNAGDVWRGSNRSIYLSPRESSSIPGGRVTTVGTLTQMATLGHLVEIDGLVIYYQGFPPDDMEYYLGELDFLAGQTGRIDLAFLPIPDLNGNVEQSGFKAFLDRFHPRAIALLDPDRREDLFPRVADLVRDWGKETQVFVARYPGDEFLLRKGG